MRILLTEEEISNGVSRLADQLAADYQGRTVTILSVLTGSLVFLADLMRKLDIPLRVGVVQAASYRGAVTRPWALSIHRDFLPELRGEHVLLLDDILDSGQTLAGLLDQLEPMEPVSLRTIVLLRKQGRQTANIHLDYWAFEIPDVFVVGYGLDYNDHYRHLPYLAALDPSDL